MPGVLGELGWWADGLIAAKNNLAFLNRALLNENSWQFRFLEMGRGHQGLPHHPLLIWYDAMSEQLDLPALPDEETSWKKAVREQVSNWAEESWREAAQEHPRLKPIYAQFKVDLTPLLRLDAVF